MPGDAAPPPPSSASRSLLTSVDAQQQLHTLERGDPETLSRLAPGRDLQGWARVLAGPTYTQGILMSCLASPPPSQSSCPFPGITLQTPHCSWVLIWGSASGGTGDTHLYPFLPGLFLFLPHPPLAYQALEGSLPCAGRASPTSSGLCVPEPHIHPSVSVKLTPQPWPWQVHRGGRAPRPGGAWESSPTGGCCCPEFSAGRGQEGQRSLPRASVVPVLTSCVPTHHTHSPNTHHTHTYTPHAHTSYIHTAHIHATHIPHPHTPYIHTLHAPHTRCTRMLHTHRLHTYISSHTHTYSVHTLHTDAHIPIHMRTLAHTHTFRTYSTFQISTTANI